jgi:hypothetical protein
MAASGGATCHLILWCLGKLCIGTFKSRVRKVAGKPSMSVGAASQDRQGGCTHSLLCSETVHNTATATGDGGVDAGKKSKGRKPFLVVHSQGHWLSVRVLSARCHNGTAALKWWPQELKKTPLLTGLKRMYGDRHLGGTFKEGVEADTTLKVIAPQEQIGVTKDGMKLHKNAGWWNAPMPGNVAHKDRQETSNESQDRQRPFAASAPSAVSYETAIDASSR